MTVLRYLLAGESHGQALTVIVEGVPAGLPVDEGYIARDLGRRQGGYGRGGRMKIEKDRAEVLSGVRHGRTLGSPIALLIRNRDWENWKTAMGVAPVAETVPLVTRPRPGHADLAGAWKYGFEEIRPILERSSARETAGRVAVGAIARRLLEEFSIQVHSHVLAIGGHKATPPDGIDWDQVEASPVRTSDPAAEKAMMAAIDAAKAGGDTVGGVFEVVATGVVPGLGSHVQPDRRLDGRLAGALMSIPSVKGVEVGLGFESAARPGSQVHDPILGGADFGQRPSNRAGGLEGGMSNGQPIVLRAAVKPIPTLGQPLPSADLLTGEPAPAHWERADTCIVPAAGVIGEAMVAQVLAEAFLEKFGGDNLAETRRNYDAYCRTLRPRGRHD